MTIDDETPVTEPHLPSEAMEPSTGQEKPCHDSPNIYNSTNSEEPLVPKVQDSAEVDLLPLSVEKSVERAQTMKLHPESEDLVERQSEEDRDFFLLHPDRTWYIRPSSDFERDVPVMNGDRTIAILAVLSGADGFMAIETYGKGKQKWLESFLDLPYGIPSHDPFSRVFGVLPENKIPAKEPHR